MAVIKKKNWPNDFKLVKAGKKTVQARVADFKVKPRDVLVLEEWNPKTRKYTGRKLRKTVKEVHRFRLTDYGQRRLIEKKGLYLIRF